MDNLPSVNNLNPINPIISQTIKINQSSQELNNKLKDYYQIISTNIAVQDHDVLSLINQANVVLIGETHLSKSDRVMQGIMLDCILEKGDFILTEGPAYAKDGQLSYLVNKYPGLLPPASEWDIDFSSHSDIFKKRMLLVRYGNAILNFINNNQEITNFTIFHNQYIKFLELSYGMSKDLTDEKWDAKIKKLEILIGDESQKSFNGNKLREYLNRELANLWTEINAEKTKEFKEFLDQVFNNRNESLVSCTLDKLQEHKRVITICGSTHIFAKSHSDSYQKSVESIFSSINQDGYKYVALVPNRTISNYIENQKIARDASSLQPSLGQKHEVTRQETIKKESIHAEIKSINDFVAELKRSQSQSEFSSHATPNPDAQISSVKLSLHIIKIDEILKAIHTGTIDLKPEIPKSMWGSIQGFFKKKS